MDRGEKLESGREVGASSNAVVDDVVEPSSGVDTNPRPTGPHRPREAPRRGWLIRRALLLADVLGLSVAFFAAEQLTPRSGDKEDLLFPFTILLWIVMAKIYG